MDVSSSIQTRQNNEIIYNDLPPPSPFEAQRAICKYFSRGIEQLKSSRTPYVKKADRYNRINIPTEDTKRKPTIKVDERDIEKANRRASFLSRSKSAPDISKNLTPTPSEPAHQSGQSTPVMGAAMSLQNAPNKAAKEAVVSLCKEFNRQNAQTQSGNAKLETVKRLSPSTPNLASFARNHDNGTSSGSMMEEFDQAITLLMRFVADV